MVDGDGPEQDAVDEVRACFEAYEPALLANDVDAMDDWFWDDPAVVRFGIAECQYGPEEIAAWRRTTAPVPADRRHVRTTVVAHGHGPRGGAPSSSPTASGRAAAASPRCGPARPRGGASCTPTSR